MRRFWGLLLTATLGAGLAMGLTAPTTLGATLTHYNVALLLIALLAIPLWPLLRRRRTVTLAMAYAGALATLTGFYMLYTKEFPFKDWLTWWHSITSFAFLGLFLTHWRHNHPRLLQFTQRLARTLPHGPAAAIAWTAGIALGILTATSGWRTRFTGENYLLISSWTIWIGVTLTWGTWLWYRRDAARARLREPRHRNRARALLDTSLFLANWLVLLTGIALLYLAAPLRSGELKYVSKWWHTATSVLFLALVSLHIGFNAHLVRAHARRVEEEMRGRGG